MSSNGTQPVNLGASALTVNPGGAFVNVNFTTTPPAGAVYPLINFGSQNLAGSFSLDPSSPGVTSLPLGRDTYNLVDNANSLQLQIIGPPVPGVAYFYGAVSNNWSDLSNSTSSNWSANAAATQDAGNVPGSITDVIFSANNLGGNAVSTVLGTNFAINSLNVNATAASTTIGNPGDSTTLTIFALADSNTNSSGYTGNPAGNGISIAAGAGPVTINVPVLLGGSQTWTNSSANELTLTNSVSGTAGSGNTQTLTLTNAAAGGTTLRRRDRKRHGRRKPGGRGQQHRRGDHRLCRTRARTREELRSIPARSRWPTPMACPAARGLATSCSAARAAQLWISTAHPSSTSMVCPAVAGLP